MMTRLSGWLFLVMSGSSFVLAIYFLFQDNKGAAGIALTLFVVSALLTRLPEIEFLKCLAWKRG